MPGTPADTGDESFDREQILKEVNSGQGYHIGAKESSGNMCSRLLYVCWNQFISLTKAILQYFIIV